MNNFLTLYKNLELQNIPVVCRDKNLRDFCELISAIEELDIFVNENIKNHNYSFGNFYANFLYAEWSEVFNNVELKGIGQLVHNLLYELAMQHPSLFKSFVKDDYDFDSQGLSGYIGYRLDTHYKPYLYSETCLQNLKQLYFSKNNHLIVWGNNKIFPDEAKVFKILQREITMHGEIPARNLAECCNIFHNIMKQKGPQIHAYADKIATDLLTENFYIHDEELSKQEQKKAGSLRKIFSILKNGKMQYVSIDFKHGMLEVVDYNNNHEGEYRFDGSYNTGSNPDHAFKTI